MKLSKVLFATVVAFGFVRPHADACVPDREKPVVFDAREYSDTAMEHAIRALRTCKTQSLCGPFAAIEMWGAKAVPALLLELEVSKDSYARRHVLKLLSTAKAPGSGAKMLAIASAIQDTFQLGEVYETAVKIDGPLLFDKLARAIVQETDDSRATALRRGLMLLPNESLSFIEREMRSSTNPLALAALADGIVTKDNAKNIAALIPLTKDLRARHRLAAAAIRGELVKEELFDTFHASLTSSNAETRDDALEHLTVDTIPERLKPLLLDVIQKQIAKGAIQTGINIARKLVDLGARDRATFDTLFTGLDSDKENDVRRALANMHRLGARVPDDLRPIYVAQVEAVLAKAPSSPTKYLGGRALTALGVVAPGS